LRPVFVKAFDKDYIIVIIVLLILVVVTIPLSLYEHRNRNESNAILNNPSFVGEVSDKDVRHLRGMSFFMMYTQYRLHIVGHYLEESEKIEVDRVFVVSSDLFQLYDIGDIVTCDSFDNS